MKAILLAIALKLLALALPGATLSPTHPIRVRYESAAADLAIASAIEGADERHARVAFTWSYFESGWQAAPKGSNDNGSACGVGQVHVAEFAPLHVLDDAWTCAVLRKDRVLGYRALLRTMMYFEAKCGSLKAGMVAFSTNGSCPEQGWTIAIVRDRCKLAGGC